MEKLIIAGKEFNSRLFLGTGKFSCNDLCHGRKQISSEEYRNVAAYWNITAAEAMDSRQLDLFDDNDNERE